MAPKSKAKAKSQSLALTSVPADAFKQLHNKLSYRKRAADTPEKASLYSEALVKLQASKEEMLEQFAKDQSLAWLPSLLKRESTETTEGSLETREWLNSYQMMEALGLRGFKLEDPMVQTELARHESKPHPNEIWRAKGVHMHRMCREVESSGSNQKSLVELTAILLLLTRPKGRSLVVKCPWTTQWPWRKPSSSFSVWRRTLRSNSQTLVACGANVTLLTPRKRSKAELKHCVRLCLMRSRKPTRVWILGQFLGYCSL